MEAVVLLLLTITAIVSILTVVRVNQLQSREQKQQILIETLAKKAEKTDSLLVENARLKSNLENEQKNSAEKIRILEESESRLKIEFENLANKIFREIGQSFSIDNVEKLDAVLEPFRQQLNNFRQRVDQVHNDSTRNSTQLLEQVRQLQQLNNRVSDEANNLAKAIKGDNKKQGDWGEFLIERIFESCGLEEGREYEKQVSLKTDSGSIQRPDFIVNLPNERSIIIDSKMSLVAYERFHNLEKIDERKNALAEHIKSVREHIKKIQEANYIELLGNRTLDFIVICIPLEPAYQLALKYDTNLIYDLANSNVVITGPTTLMITLKLISQIWRRDKENKNINEIATSSGRIYDQVVLVLESVVNAQKKLFESTEALDKVMKQMTTGKGSLVSRVEKIRKLGAKVKKEIPESIVRQANNEDEDENE